MANRHTIGSKVVSHCTVFIVLTVCLSVMYFVCNFIINNNNNNNNSNNNNNNKTSGTWTVERCVIYGILHTST